MADTWEATVRSLGMDPTLPGSGQLEVRPLAAGARANAFDLDLSRELVPGSVLGEGGMGLVRLARQSSLGREVAVKTLRATCAADLAAREAFLGEARVTGLLEHPNIIPVHALGRDETGGPILAMARIEGSSWGELIRREPPTRSLRRHVEVLASVVDAVAFAHRTWIVHRDLKPANVLVGSLGEVYVIDWGIAVDVSSGPLAGKRGAPTPAEAGCAGTPCYMSPEQASDDAGRVGPPADVYLLGAILHELLTGRPPHGGRTFLETIAHVAKNEVFPVRAFAGAPPELVALAEKCLATRPDARPTAPEVRESLRRFLTGDERRSEAEAFAVRARAALEAPAGSRYAAPLEALSLAEAALERAPRSTNAREVARAAERALLGRALEARNLAFAEGLLERIDDPDVERTVAQSLAEARLLADPVAHRWLAVERIAGVPIALGEAVFFASLAWGARASLLAALAPLATALAAVALAHTVSGLAPARRPVYERAVRLAVLVLVLAGVSFVALAFASADPDHPPTTIVLAVLVHLGVFRSLRHPRVRALAKVRS